MRRSVRAKATVGGADVLVAADPIQMRLRELERDGVTVEVLEGARHHPLSGEGLLEVGARIRDWLEK